MADFEEGRALVAQRLREARQLAGLSQGQVARHLEVARPTISEMEAGRRRVTAEETVALAKLYQVDAGWLAGAEVEAQPRKIELVARELSSLSLADLERVLHLITILRK